MLNAWAVFLPFSVAAPPPAASVASNAVPLTDITFIVSFDFTVWIAFPEVKDQ